MLSEKTFPNYNMKAYFFIIGIFLVNNAHAYLDPGSGNAIIYLLLSLAGALLYYLKSFFYKVISFLTGKKISHDKNERVSIFSEGKNYWLTYKPIVEELISNKISFIYYTIDIDDPALLIDNEYMHSRYVGGGDRAFAKVGALKTPIMITTTPNIGSPTYPLRRPGKVKKLASFSDESNKTESDKSTLKNKIHEQDFLTVGSMGHASSIALGIALQKPDRQIICIDGDGAALMHMGAMATIGQSGVKKYVHIVINNGAHESVGGFPTTSPKVDLVSTAKNCGYSKIWSVETETELLTALKEIGSDSSNELQSGAYFMEIKCSQGSRSDLGRPTLTAVQNKLNFMKMLKQ